MADYRLVDAAQLDADLTTVADAIREKAGTSDALTFPDGMAAAVANIPTGGGDDYLQFATTASFNNLNLFGKSEVHVQLPNVDRLSAVFSQGGAKNQTVEHITLTCTKPQTHCGAAFYAGSGEDNTLKRITLNVDMSASTTMATMFYRLHSLKTIDGTPLDATSNTNFASAFGNCQSLEEVRFAPQTIKAAIGFPNSTKLSAATIESIVNGLSPDTSDLTVTFAKQAVNTAFETAAGAADGSTSAEWLALIGTRSNWTVSLA